MKSYIQQEWSRRMIIHLQHGQFCWEFLAIWTSRRKLRSGCLQRPASSSATNSTSSFRSPPEDWIKPMATNRTIASLLCPSHRSVFRSNPPFFKLLFISPLSISVLAVFYFFLFRLFPFETKVILPSISVRSIDTFSLVRVSSVSLCGWP